MIENIAIVILLIMIVVIAYVAFKGIKGMNNDIDEEIKKYKEIRSQQKELKAFRNKFKIQVEERYGEAKE